MGILALLTYLYEIPAGACPGLPPTMSPWRQFRANCAVLLERTQPPWKLDRKESTRLSLKYRRGKGEILIVSQAGKGWWEGDVFDLVQWLEPGLTFGQGCRIPRLLHLHC
jgi:hypothetical protein